jgi:hypothetical protein
VKLKVIIGFICGFLAMTFAWWISGELVYEKGSAAVFWYLTSIIGGICGILVSKIIEG